MNRRIVAALPAIVLAVFLPHVALGKPQAAATAAPAAAGPRPGEPAAYDAFVKGASVSSGLIPIITKNGDVFLELQTAQLGKDFIETSVPLSGLGGFGPAPGEPYVAPARILRFERYGNKIVLRWPNTYALTAENSPEREGVEQTLPSSIVAVTPVVAQDDSRVVISADPFLGDVADLASSLRFAAAKSPAHAYRIDPTKSFFIATKSFPENDVLRVDQTWVSEEPDFLDNAPDPRNVEVKMTYNLIQAPDDGYMARIADPRVGYFSQPLLNFTTDREMRRDVHYLNRWNFGPRTSAAPVQAANPIVFYLSNDIPQEYRESVRAALLTWNNAFAKIGILNAVKVEQQPSDPSWDSDDIRHNIVRWVDTSDPQYGAEALIISDPRTGEELNVGVNFDAVEGISGRLIYKYVVAPVRGLPDSAAAERAFADNVIRAVILHESGHDLGLQHNFIGHEAYTAAELQSKSFTSKYGIASSVMEYAPVNLWPKGTPQGDYNQLVLGPYDYYAVHYGYGYIAGAQTPQQELPTLERWASRWTDPRYRFASDEDADEFLSGHSVDPRVVQYNLTNHPIAWCATQMKMLHGLMDSVSARFPEQGMPYDQARSAFLAPMRQYSRCAIDFAHSIGGEYLSRAQRGDPGAGAPIRPIPIADERRAWQELSDGLFSDAAWRFNSRVLDTLTYSEFSDLSVSATWAYNPAPTHDVSILSLVQQAQTSALRELYSPARLQRIDEFSLRFPGGATMNLTDLFDWSRGSIFGDLTNGGVARDGLVRRNLQVIYAKMLSGMLTNPMPGTPGDAQGLARVQLEDLQHDAAVGLGRSGLDELTRAHLELLRSIAEQGLTARPIVAGPPAAAPEM
jgi:hypothetical protein